MFFVSLSNWLKHIEQEVSCGLRGQATFWYICISVQSRERDRTRGRERKGKIKKKKSGSASLWLWKHELVTERTVLKIKCDERLPVTIISTVWASSTKKHLAWRTTVHYHVFSWECAASSLSANCFTSARRKTASEATHCVRGRLGERAQHKRSKNKAISWRRKQESSS